MRIPWLIGSSQWFTTWIRDLLVAEALGLCCNSITLIFILSLHLRSAHLLNLTQNWKNTNSSRIITIIQKLQNLPERKRRRKRNHYMKWLLSFIILRSLRQHLVISWSLIEITWYCEICAYSARAQHLEGFYPTCTQF